MLTPKFGVCSRITNLIKHIGRIQKVIFRLSTKKQNQLCMVYLKDLCWALYYFLYTSITYMHAYVFLPQGNLQMIQTYFTHEILYLQAPF